MKYKIGENGFSRWLLLFYCFAFIIANSIQTHFPPWDPSRRWFELVYTVLSLLLVIYVLYDWVQMRRYYRNEGAQAPEKVRRRQVFGYWVMFIVCVGLMILKLTNFVWYQSIPVPF